MIHSMKRLRSDRRGNVLAIVGAAIPLVVGSAGLATDTIQWVTWKRELQRAADSAAFAGVLAKAQGASTADSAVSDDLAKNNTTGIALLSGYPQISYPTSANYSGAVRVTVAIQKRLSFSSLFISQAPIITTTATAALIDQGRFCLWALHDGSEPGISINGSANAAIGCPAVANSNGDPSVKPDGNAYTISAPLFSGAGNMPTSITGVTQIKSYQMPQPDPFKDKYSTDIPSSETCKNSNQHMRDDQPGPGKDFHFEPGCYTDFHITGNETYTLDPGVYYIKNADFNMAGDATLQGEGVTIILTGDTPGSIKTNGNTTIQLTAPTSGDYKNMLFIQSGNAGVDNLNEINGSNTSKWDGSLYFPNGIVKFNGSGAATTRCLMVVANKLDFSGSSNVQNDVSDCDADQTVPGKVIRLIA